MKSLKPTPRLQKSLFGLALLVTTSACGPSGPLMAPSDSLRGSRSSSYGLSNSAGQCIGGSLTSRYTGLSESPEIDVCTDEQDYYKVRVSGTVSASSQSQPPTSMCFFPAEYYAASSTTSARVLYKIDVQTGGPMMSCVNLGHDSNGEGTLRDVEISFNLTNYNYLYAVRMEDATRMKGCLIAKDERLCPPYSRGLFRAASTLPGQSGSTTVSK